LLGLGGCLPYSPSPPPAPVVEIDAGGIIAPPPDAAEPSDAATGSVPASADALFEATVLPVLRDNCQACHSSDHPGEGPDYLGGPTTAFYAALTMNARLIGDSPANSLLVNKGAHAGPALTDAQKADLSAFITLWNQERGSLTTDAGAPAVTLTQALDKFARCMTRADWDANNLDELGAQATTQGPCASCHASGTGGNWLALTANGQNPTFARQKQLPYVMKWVLGTVDDQGAFKGLVMAHRFRDKGQEPGSHPRYVLSTARVQGVEGFINATLAHYNAGECLP